MKRIFTAVTILLLSATAANACDICGCGVGNSYIGILPDFSKKIAGIRYRYNSLQTHIGAGFAITYLTTSERYRTMEFWGGWNINSKFRLMVSLPFNFNEKQNQGTVARKSGAGDFSISGFYNLLNKKRTTAGNKLLVQSLWIGAGVKLPTGEYIATDKSQQSDDSNLFQLGTGSFDFSANLMYDVRLQDAGINLNAGYKVNTANKYDYRYGNKFNLSTQAYYKFKLANNFSIAPNAGVQFEKAKRDIDLNQKADASGGRILLGTTGVESVIKRFLLGANYQIPLSQNLANRFVQANNRWMMHCAIAF